MVDLSSPAGASVNDGIDSEWASVSYATVDMLALVVLEAGRGSFLVKADVKEAYRMVPVHPQDRWLLGISWGPTVYVDNVLPFGLRSAPKIFTAIADAAQWLMVNRGVDRLLHYMDDFAFVAESRMEAERKKQLLVSVWSELGIPLEPAKLEGPATCLTFLGIEVDTMTLQLRLPSEKLARLAGVLEAALGKKLWEKGTSRAWLASFTMQPRW